MDSVLVDTNVISYLIKSDSRSSLYQPHLAGKRLVISFMTVAELYAWAKGRNWSDSRIEWLRKIKLSQYLVVPFDDGLAWEWAQICTIKGRPIAIDDAWIAATARHHGLPLVTHNRKHFEHIPNLRILSEAP